MSEIAGFSEALVKLVSEAAPGVVAVKAGAYRTASGVVIDGEHLAVPEHALKRRDSIPFTTHLGEHGVAKVLGRDPGIDLAILRVEDLKLRPIARAEDGALTAGMLALVVGMTRDVGASVSAGILGAVGPERRTWRGGVLDRFIRLDVNLYPSQYGAAVVDAVGKLIGMATPALSRQSAMAVPLTTIQRVLTELHKEGRIRVGYLGVGVQPVAIPEALRAKTANGPAVGLILLSVVPGAAADLSGLQVGDILLSLNGNTLEDVEQLQAQLRGEYIGKDSELVILRGGEPRTLSVVIQESERKQG